MCTKFWSDGDVHKYFSPYDSPYDAYMYFMNAFSDFGCTLKECMRTEKTKAKVSCPRVNIKNRDVAIIEEAT